MDIIEHIVHQGLQVLVVLITDIIVTVLDHHILHEVHIAVQVEVLVVLGVVIEVVVQVINRVVVVIEGNNCLKTLRNSKGFFYGI